MHHPDYMDEELFFGRAIVEDDEDVRDRMLELAPFMLLNRFMAMDFETMPEMHRTFAHIGPLIKKLTLRDHGPSMHQFNSRVGKVAGRLIMDYCRNGTFQNKDLVVGFNRSKNGREKVFELAKFLTNLKTLDCYKVRDTWNFFIQKITQYCPALERLTVVADFISCEDFDVGLIIPHHTTLQRIKINLQAYNHSGIATIMSGLGKMMKERTPNLVAIDFEIEIDAYCEEWTYEQEVKFLSRFDENAVMYSHFKQMDKLKRCVFSYTYLYEGVATLEVKL